MTVHEQEPQSQPEGAQAENSDSDTERSCGAEHEESTAEDETLIVTVGNIPETLSEAELVAFVNGAVLTATGQEACVDVAPCCGINGEINRGKGEARLRFRSETAAAIAVSLDGIEYKRVQLRVEGPAGAACATAQIGAAGRDSHGAADQWTLPLGALLRRSGRGPRKGNASLWTPPADTVAAFKGLKAGVWGGSAGPAWYERTWDLSRTPSVSSAASARAAQRSARALSHYEVLGVPASASGVEIRRAFRSKCKQLNADGRLKQPTPKTVADFTKMVEAYRTLADNKKRDAYDRRRLPKELSEANSNGDPRAVAFLLRHLDEEPVHRFEIERYYEPYLVKELPRLMKESGVDMLALKGSNTESDTTPTMELLIAGRSEAAIKAKLLIMNWAHCVRQAASANQAKGAAQAQAPQPTPKYAQPPGEGHRMPYCFPQYAGPFPWQTWSTPPPPPPPAPQEPVAQEDVAAATRCKARFPRTAPAASQAAPDSGPSASATPPESKRSPPKVIHAPVSKAALHARQGSPATREKPVGFAAKSKPPSARDSGDGRVVQDDAKAVESAWREALLLEAADEIEALLANERRSIDESLQAIRASSAAQMPDQLGGRIGFAASGRVPQDCCIFAALVCRCSRSLAEQGTQTQRLLGLATEAVSRMRACAEVSQEGIMKAAPRELHRKMLPFPPADVMSAIVSLHVQRHTWDQDALCGLLQAATLDLHTYKQGRERCSLSTATAAVKAAGKAPFDNLLPSDKHFIPAAALRVEVEISEGAVFVSTERNGAFRDFAFLCSYLANIYHRTEAHKEKVLDAFKLIAAECYKLADAPPDAPAFDSEGITRLAIALALTAKESSNKQKDGASGPAPGASAAAVRAAGGDKGFAVKALTSIAICCVARIAQGPSSVWSPAQVVSLATAFSHVEVRHRALFERAASLAESSLGERKRLRERGVQNSPSTWSNEQLWRLLDSAWSLRLLSPMRGLLRFMLGDGTLGEIAACKIKASFRDALIVLDAAILCDSPAVLEDIVEQVESVGAVLRGAPIERLVSVLDAWPTNEGWDNLEWLHAELLNMTMTLASRSSSGSLTPEQVRTLLRLAGGACGDDAKEYLELLSASPAVLAVVPESAQSCLVWDSSSNNSSQSSARGATPRVSVVCEEIVQLLGPLAAHKAKAPRLESVCASALLIALRRADVLPADLPIITSAVRMLAAGASGALASMPSVIAALAALPSVKDAAARDQFRMGSPALELFGILLQCCKKPDDDEDEEVDPSFAAWVETLEFAALGDAAEDSTPRDDEECAPPASLDAMSKLVDRCPALREAKTALGPSWLGALLVNSKKLAWRGATFALSRPPPFKKAMQTLAEDLAGVPAAGAAPCEEWPPVLLVTYSKDDHFLETVGGTYCSAGMSYGRPAFKRTSPGDVTDVLLFYWDDPESEEQCGWWFGPFIGSSEVWLRHRLSGDGVYSPPRAGWEQYANGEVLERLAVVDCSQLAASPLLMDAVDEEDALENAEEAAALSRAEANEAQHVRCKSEPGGDRDSASSLSTRSSHDKVGPHSPSAGDCGSCGDSHATTPDTSPVLKPSLFRGEAGGSGATDSGATEAAFTSKRPAGASDHRASAPSFVVVPTSKRGRSAGVEHSPSPRAGTAPDAVPDSCARKSEGGGATVQREVPKKLLPAKRKTPAHDEEAVKGDTDTALAHDRSNMASGSGKLPRGPLANEGEQNDNKRQRSDFSIVPSSASDDKLRKWLLSLDKEGKMLQYYDVLNEEFDGDLSQISAAKTVNTAAPTGVVSQIDPIFWETVKVTKMGHKLIFAKAILEL